MPRLTDISLKALKVPEKGQVMVWDDPPGFGVRVSQGGTKTFVIIHGPQRERATIGRYPIISLSEARTAAKRFLAEKTLGKRANPTLRFDDALAVFLETQTERLRPSTKRDYERILRSHFARPFKGKALTEIQTHHVTAIIDKLLPTKAECNYAFAVGRRFFRWAVSRRYIPHSPLEGIGMPTKIASRERVLSAGEIAEVWKKADQGIFGAIVRLCILTGQRRGELATLRSDWIDRATRTITFPASITKNKRSHTIPFCDSAERYLDGDGLLFPARGKDTPFNGWSKGKASFDKRLENVEPFTLHDLRRSVATQWAALGIAPHVVERMLNHISGTVSGVAAIYNRHAYLDEMRVAIDAWEKRLSVILAQHNSDDSNGSPPP